MTKNKKEKNVFNRVISIFAWLSLIFAIIMSTICIFATFSSEQNGKEIFGVKMLIVASDSMSKSPLSENEEVFFNSGDIVIIKKVDDTKSFNVGDVITFVSYNSDSYGKTLTHKIRQVKYNSNNVVIGYETYGINTGVSDQAIVTPNTILGVYVNKIPNLGRIFAYLKTPSGYYLSILTPAMLLIIFFSIKVGASVERNKKVSKYTQEIETLKQRILALESINTAIEQPKNENQPKVELATTSLAQNVEEESSFVVENSFVDNLITQKKKTSFAQKILSLKVEVQNYFDSIHNELISYKKVHDRVSFRGISYRYGKKLLAKMTVRGKTLKLHLALDVNEFNYNTYYQKDLSNVKAYEQVPFTVKVKSERGAKNAITLVKTLAEQNQLIKNDKFNKINSINMLKELSVKEEPFGIETQQNQAVEFIIAKGKKISFSEKVKSLKKEIQQYFSSTHNEIISYKKVHDRVSFRGISYRYGKKLLAKMTVRGKTLKLHLALDVNEFNYNTYYQKDLSNVKAYEQVPFTVKVKSERGAKNAIKLVTALMEKNEIAKNLKFNQVDVIKLLSEKN